jgi:hypothetical protein
MGYMHDMDKWIDENVIDLLLADEDGADELTDETVSKVKSAICEKLLESYHNGQSSGVLPRATAHKGGMRTFRKRPRATA